MQTQICSLTQIHTVTGTHTHMHTHMFQNRHRHTHTHTHTHRLLQVHILLLLVLLWVVQRECPWEHSGRGRPGVSTSDWIKVRVNNEESVCDWQVETKIWVAFLMLSDGPPTNTGQGGNPLVKDPSLIITSPWIPQFFYIISVLIWNEANYCNIFFCKRQEDTNWTHNVTQNKWSV